MKKLYKIEMAEKLTDKFLNKLKIIGYKMYVPIFQGKSLRYYPYYIDDKDQVGFEKIKKK